MVPHRKLQLLVDRRVVEFDRFLEYGVQIVHYTLGLVATLPYTINFFLEKADWIALGERV